MPERLSKSCGDVSRWPKPKKRLRRKEIRQAKDHLLRSYEKAPWVSEIQDKGDLFFIEQYVDAPRSGHSTEQPKQTTEIYQQNGGHVAKDKRFSGNKLSDIISRMKKTKKASDIVSLHQKDADKQQDAVSADRDTKLEVKLRVNPPRIGPYKRDDLESVLGIIPKKSFTENGRNSISQEYGRDSRIVIAGFTPTGPAITSNQLEIGDVILALNGLELHTSNVNAMLGAIPGSMEVTLKIQKHPPTITQSPIAVNGFVPNDDHLLKIISGRRESDTVSKLQDIPHAVMFLSLDISSEDEIEKDILFQFPKDSASKKVISLRGIFLTLGDLLSSVTGSTPRSTSVVIDGKLIHIGYQKYQKEILILALPASQAPLFCMDILMENLSKLLCVMFGSLHRAFCDDCNTLRLEHFFSLIFEYVLGTKSIFVASNKTVDPLDGFLNCIEGARWLDLSSESKVHIDTCLNELEANDCEWADELFTIRRQYLVLGSCLFYKGVLIGNHLPATEDLQDIVLYCRFHCLFTTSEQQRLAQLVIWREVFLTRQKTENSDSPLISNYEPRTFLLIVGLKHFLFCIILEAGVLSQRANGNPGPDPYYIDQAKNILYELEHLDIPSVCEARFQNPSSPPTASADLTVLRSKSGSVDKLSHESKGKLAVGSMENLRSSGLEETESVHSETSGGNVGPLSPYRRRRQSSNVSDGSKGSTGSGGRMMSRNMPAAPLTLAKLRKDTEDIGDLKFNYLNKLSSGEENTMFHYVMHNTFNGIIMSPFATASKGKLHDAVLENFNKSCVKIRRYFRHNTLLKKEKTCGVEQTKFSSSSPDTITEMGIQFCVADNKRHEPLLKYWVKGRLILNGGPKEFYVCYQDSAAQVMVELAFKLGFGSQL